MKLFFSCFLFSISFAVFGQSNSNENVPKLGESKSTVNKSGPAEKTNGDVVPAPKLSMTGTESQTSGSQTNSPVVLPQKPVVFSIDKIDPKDQPK